ncbi:MAG: DUF4105 domain-containing protein, partial [Methylotenera sp.]|nr:DUF4105 domain-containing protein [Oligoflexia bacterium]
VPATAAEPSASTALSHLYDTSAKRASELKLAESRPWLKLLHYERGFWGFHELQAGGESFFLSAAGQHEPESELDATLRGIFLPQEISQPAPAEKTPPNPANPLDAHVRCRFPARTTYLLQVLGISENSLPPVKCPGYETFRTRASAKSVSVVFSSYYLNNPSSAFGHTLLRLNKTPHSQEGERHELLDRGIGYASVMGNDNPLVYSIKGITGLYPGTFTDIPYFYKVREYNDFEARDLWSYDLDITQAQVDQLVAHLWEVGNTWFAYYYFTENCAYHLLSVLEAAKPDLNLLKRLPKIVIPVDSIRVINSEPGLVRKVTYRPSVRAQFFARSEALTPEQQDSLDELNATHDPSKIPAHFRPEERAAILDAATDWLELNHNRDLVFDQGLAPQWKQSLLVARSKLGIPSLPLEVAPPVEGRPDSGHGTRRAIFEGGHSRENRGFGMLHYRFALHDLLDPQSGFPSYAQIEMFAFKLRYDWSGTGLSDSSKLRLWQADLFNIFALNPLQRFNRKASWRIQGGATRIFDRNCQQCLAANIEGGNGLAYNPLKFVPLTVFALLEGQFSASGNFEGSHFRPAIGPMAGVRLALMNGFSVLLQSRYRYQLFAKYPHDSALEAGARWAVSPTFALNLRGTVQPHLHEAAAGLVIYH